MALETGNSLYWKTKISTEGLKQGATESKGILRGLTRSITGMDIFVGLGISAALVFSKITKMAYNFSKDFEHAMREVMTISDATKRNFKGISDEIVKMSKIVPDTAIKLSKAFYQIVSAGYDGAKAMDILKISADLAVAGVTDTMVAADAITYVMNSFGKAAGDAENIAGKLFMTVKLGKVTMEELAPSVSKVAGMWAQAGGSFLDLMASIATGVKSLPIDIMTTAIRGILAAIISPTEDAKKVINELGIEFDATTLATKGFSYILLEMKKAVGDDADKMEKLAAIFPNVRGLIGALALDTEKYTEALEAMSKGTEEFNEATKIMVTDTTNQLAILKNNIMAKLKPIGDSILKSMNDMASGINQAMSGINDEFSNLARAYSELTDTLRKKQSRIDDLITTVEDLRSKTELTREETTQLEAAERALAIFYPTFEKAVGGATGKIDLLTLAKKDSYELSKRIMELELRQAEIEKRRADLALAIYRRGKDEANKEIKRMQDRLDRFRQELSIQQIIELQTTGAIKEEIKLENELALAVEDRALEQEQLILNVEKTTSEIDALTEALEKLGKPIIIPPEPEKPPEKKPVTILALTDEQIKDIEDKLKYMASQYKRYLSDIAQFGEEYIEEHNAQLAEEGKNYANYLSDMAVKYKDNAELSRIIFDDIYEYNKLIIAKRKEEEEKYFEFITKAREKELQIEKERFEAIIKNYKEGSAEYLKAVEKYEENILKIKTDYAEKESEARLILFKAGWEKQIGEEKEAYIKRLEAKLKELESEKVIDIKRVEFIRNKLNIIRILEKESADKKREILDSYFKSYQTTEEKIVSIHKRTAELLSLTDIKYERDRLKIIEKQLIAEVKFGEARQEINDKIAEYGERLNNQELEKYIKFLEEMKSKYSEYADVIILLNEKIADSQKQIWENTRDEINKTVDLLHSLADAVGDFDTEISQMINNIANLVSGIGQITFGFAMGNIFGILGGIITAVSSIFNLFVVHHSDVEEIEEELHQITLELQEQQNILSQAIGTEKLKAMQDMIDLLRQQVAMYNEMIAAEQEAYGQFLWWTWSEADQNKIEQWLASIQNINAEIANLNQQYREILTGTTAEAIADAIAEGFSQGLDSAQVFADTFNDMMKKAIVDAFKRTIITKYIEDWYNTFAVLSQGITWHFHVMGEGLTANEIAYLASEFQNMLNLIETEWGAIEDIFEAAGIDLFEEITIPEIIEEAKEAMKSIADITEETIADSIADGFHQGLTSAEVFTDTFNDMMRKAIIGAFKEVIVTKYIKSWYDQFTILYEGGLTAQEIQALTGTYQNVVEAAATQWKTMEAVLEAAGIELEEIRRVGLKGAIAGITEETAGLLAGQFQAIRINTVGILNNMENIIIINARIADNTEYNKYLTHLENIDNKLSNLASLESEHLREVGGA